MYLSNSPLPLLLPPLLEVLTISYVLGFTLPSSIIRPAALPVLLGYTYLALLGSNAHLRAEWASMFVGGCVAIVLNYVNLALLSKWSFEASGPTSQPGHGIKSNGKKSNGTAPGVLAAPTYRETSWQRLQFGSSCVLSFRHVNGPFEVKNTPPFSTQDSGYVPYRKTFLWRSALDVLVCVLILDLAESQPPPENNAELFSPQKVPLLSRLSDIQTDEVFLRLFGTIGFWVILYCLLRAVAGAFSLLPIALGWSNVESWRPINGPLLKAYTIRQFWGNFWHQCLREPVSNPASFIAEDVLKLPKGSILNRYTKVFVAFFVSGLLHMIADLALGLSVFESGALRFFCTQPLGIIIEDAVQALYRYASGTKRGNGTSPLWTRLLGYTWVMAFLFWSTPVWFYPNAARSKEDQKFLPFSIVSRYTKN